MGLAVEGFCGFRPVFMFLLHAVVFKVPVEEASGSNPLHQIDKEAHTDGPM